MGLTAAILLVYMICMCICMCIRSNSIHDTGNMCNYFISTNEKIRLQKDLKERKRVKLKRGISSKLVASLVPRPLPKEGRGPGTHCLRMRENTPGFYGGSYNYVPYRRLYPWTVRDRPFYCLGVALQIWPVVASFLPLSPTLFLKLEKDWC